MKRIGIIGFGDFGQFMAKHLKPYADISVYDPRSDLPQRAEEVGVQSASLESVAEEDVVIFAVPVQHLEGVLKRTAPIMKAGATAVDVSSVKVNPLKLMEAHLPESVNILGTHPLFGPQSGKDGIAGLKIVLCDVRGVDTQKVGRWLTDNLKLEVLHRTADEHDKEMAMVQGLTHFLAKALIQMNLKPCEMDTIAYNRMMDVMHLVGNDSMALFETIQNQNPYCAEVRESFVKAFHGLEVNLNKTEQA